MPRTRPAFVLTACLVLPAALLPSHGLFGAKAPQAQGGLLDGFGDPLPPDAVGRLGTVRLRHAAAVRQLEFLANGRILASVGQDKFFHLWDAATGKELFRYGWEREAPTPSGNTLVVRGSILMETRLNAPKRGAVFSRDGCLLALRDRPNSVLIIDLNARRELRRFEMEKTPLIDLTFSPDSKVLAGSSKGGPIYIWDVASGRKIRELQTGSVGAYGGLVFSPNGLLLAGISTDHVRLWDTASGKRLRRYEAQGTGTISVAFSPDSKKLATAADSTISLWETESEEELRKLTLLKEQSVIALAIAPDGKTLAAGVNNGVHLCNLATGKETRSISVPESLVQSLAFGPHGKTLAAGLGDGKIRLWDPTTGKELVPLPALGQVVFLAPSAGGKSVVLGCVGQSVHHWDLKLMKELHRFTPPPGEYPAWAITPDGKTVALTEGNGVIGLWDTGKNKQLRRLEGHRGAILDVLFSPDGKSLASIGADYRSLRLWKVATGKEFVRLVPPAAEEQQGAQAGFAVLGLAFSDDARTLVGVIPDGRLHLWETATGKERFSFPANPAECTHLVLSRDGSLLAQAGNDEVIRLRNAYSGKLVHFLLGQEGNPNVLAISPDGKFLASGGDDKRVHLWNVATGKEVYRFVGHQGPVLSLAFTPDGTMLLSGSADGTALVWDLGAVSRKKPTPVAPPDRSLAGDWRDLGSADASVAYRALADLVRRPAEAVPFVRKHLPPAPVVEPARVGQLIADLDSPRFAVRARANRALEELAGQAAPAVRKALAGKPSSEAARRLKKFLATLDRPVSSPDQLRTLRAVEALEKIGTPEARRLLTDLAGGAPGALLTREARASLERLATRLKDKP